MPNHQLFILACVVVFLILLPASVVAQCEEAVLTSSDPDAGDRFGHSVSLDGDYALVGAPRDEYEGVCSGAAYVFRRHDNNTPRDPSDDSWIEMDTLLGLDREWGDYFGDSVSLFGDRALVGAYGITDPQFADGVAYIFLRNDGGTPSDPSDDDWEREIEFGKRGQFGRSVALGPDWAMVGAPLDDELCSDCGAVYAYRRDDNGTPEIPLDDQWVEQVKLTASIVSTDRIEFGRSVALSGKYVLIGAPEDWGAVTESGSAYIFRHEDNGTPDDLSDDTWVEEDKLVPFEGTRNTEFGESVSLTEGLALVGAWKEENSAGMGAAYLYRHDDGDTPEDQSDDSWKREGKLLPSIEAPADRFGYSVALDGDMALIGSPRDDDGQHNASGSAYLFRYYDNGTPDDPNDDIWREQFLLRASERNEEDRFGESVSLSGDKALIGAVWGGGLGRSTGTAHLFEVGEKPDANNILAGAGNGSEPWVSLFLQNGITAHKMFESHDSDFTDGIFVAVGTLSGTCRDADEIVIGPDRCTLPECSRGTNPLVKVFSKKGEDHGSFLAEDILFHGGIRVACGDVDGDGWSEIVTANGEGALETAVRIWDRNYSLLQSIVPFPGWQGGAFVACGDVDGDGRYEIVVSRDSGPRQFLPDRVPTVKVYEFLEEEAFAEFEAYKSTFKGGVRVACGDLDGRPGEEIITAPGRSGSPHIRAFKPEGNVVRQWFAYRATFKGGVFVASGEACPEPGNEVVTGADQPGGPHIRVFHADGTICESYIEGVTTHPKSGIRVAVGSFRLFGLP